MKSPAYLQGPFINNIQQELVGNFGEQAKEKKISEVFSPVPGIPTGFRAQESKKEEGNGGTAEKQHENDIARWLCYAEDGIKTLQNPWQKNLIGVIQQHKRRRNPFQLTCRKFITLHSFSSFLYKFLIFFPAGAALRNHSIFPFRETRKIPSLKLTALHPANLKMSLQNTVGQKSKSPARSRSKSQKIKNTIFPGASGQTFCETVLQKLYTIYSLYRLSAEGTQANLKSHGQDILFHSSLESKLDSTKENCSSASSFQSGFQQSIICNPDLRKNRKGQKAQSNKGIHCLVDSHFIRERSEPFNLIR